MADADHDGRPEAPRPRVPWVHDGAWPRGHGGYACPVPVRRAGAPVPVRRRSRRELG